MESLINAYEINENDKIEPVERIIDLEENKKQLIIKIIV
jgi:hypothetical protein